MKSFKDLINSSKKHIALVLAVALTIGGIPFEVSAHDQGYNQYDIKDIEYYLDQDISFVSEYAFLELKEDYDKVILEKIQLDEYTTLIRYEYENEAIEGNSILVFKKVAISTWVAFKNPEVTRRLGTVVSSSKMGLMNAKRTSIVRTAIRNQLFGSEAALGQRIANELVRQTGMRQGDADAIGLGVRQLVRWR
ncbi:MAG: hypothetical protein FWG67_04520 [Defluviitaleaceae bacterium]|nr:hypothetical protein [Defluviitaleaceae bacterium]